MNRTLAFVLLAAALAAVPALADEPPVAAPGEAAAPALAPEDAPPAEGADQLPPPPAEEVPPPPPPPTDTAVLAIEKRHDQPWRCAYLSVCLDVDLQVVGQRGRFVGVQVDFFVAGTGEPIRSVLLPFANRTGQVSVWTKFVPAESDTHLFRTALCVPYRAFPCPGAGDSYAVEARVRILRHDGPAATTELASGSTTFTVHSRPSGGGGAPRSNGSSQDASVTGFSPGTCAERLVRWRERGGIEWVYDSPVRARKVTPPLCPVPGS